MKRSMRPAYDDPEFGVLAGRALSAVGFVHLRWATSGLAVAPANTHPFLAGGWAFAHQGSIPSPERMDALLGPKWRARRLGTTDSERYFLCLLQAVERQGDLVAGIRRAVSDVSAACGAASLNALLLSESSLVVVHGRADLEPPLDELMEAVATPDDIPPEHLDKYFRIRYRRLGDDVVVTSSGLTEEGGWEELPPCSILQVDLAERSIAVHGFDGVGSPAEGERLRPPGHGDPVVRADEAGDGPAPDSERRATGADDPAVIAAEDERVSSACLDPDGRLLCQGWATGGLGRAPPCARAGRRTPVTSRSVMGEADADELGSAALAHATRWSHGRA